MTDLIKQGLLIEDGMNYRTDDGRIIRRYQGRGKRKGSYVQKWEIDGRLYDNLFGAYRDDAKEDGYGLYFYAYLPANYKF